MSYMFVILSGSLHCCTMHYDSITNYVLRHMSYVLPRVTNSCNFTWVTLVLAKNSNYFSSHHLFSFSIHFFLLYFHLHSYDNSQESSKGKSLSRNIKSELVHGTNIEDTDNSSSKVYKTHK